MKLAEMLEMATVGQVIPFGIYTYGTLRKIAKAAHLKRYTMMNFVELRQAVVDAGIMASPQTELEVRLSGVKPVEVKTQAQSGEVPAVVEQVETTANTKEVITMAKIFAVGQKFTIKGRGEWKVTKRTHCFVTVTSGFITERCKVRMGSDGIESIAIKRSGDVLGRKDYICANVVEAPAIDVEFTASIAEQAQDEQTAHAVSDTTSAESTQPAQPDSYEIGKQIVSLKGNAKAQQALVQGCGEEFLLNMYRVFPNAAPIRITMETPDELRVYLCRDVIRVVRDAEYARRLLDDVQHRLNVRYEFDNQQYLESWAKFLEEYAAPKKVLTVEEQIAYLKQCIRDARYSRAFARHFALMWKGTEHYTAEIRRLIKECNELKRQVINPAVVLSEQYEAPAVVEQPAVIQEQVITTPKATATKQDQKERAKANRFFRTMGNQQIAFALGLYREAMEWAKTQDFSAYSRVTTRFQVEEWVRSSEAQEAKGLYDGWIDYLDHYSRMLNVKIKGHSGFDEPTNADEEDSLVQSITDRVALIGPDPRAIECEKAYREELEAKHQAAMKRIEGYIQAANGGLIEYTDDLYREISNYYCDYEDEKAVRKAIAEYNCEVLSQYGTRETLITAITQANPMTIARTLYLLSGKQINGRRALDTWSINKFMDWYIASEYYHPEVHAENAQSVVTYADVDDAYFAFTSEETMRCTAGEEADFTLCNKLEREYLRLLAAYRQTDMPEGQEVLKFIRENYHDDCELARKSPWELNEMAMKCGINGHSYRHTRELVKDLARTADIPVLSDWTSLTIFQKRKQLQEGLHYTWQLRHGMKKLKKLYQAGAISNEDYQAICFVCDWELRSGKNAPFLEYYKEVCRVYGEVKKRELSYAG